MTPQEQPDSQGKEMCDCGFPQSSPIPHRHSLPDSQDRLIDFIKDPETINKAVEGSIDKRLAAMDSQAGDETYGDIIGCVSQYFYEGWRYRLPQEGDTKIRKESNEAAHRMVDPFLSAYAATVDREAREDGLNIWKGWLVYVESGGGHISRTQIKEMIAELESGLAALQGPLDAQ